MTTPDVEAELERLYAAARAGTSPGASDKARIRAALDSRLTSESAVVRRGMTGTTWLGIGAMVVGIGAGVLWFSSPSPSTPQRAHRELPAAPPLQPPKPLLTSPPVVPPPSRTPTSSPAPREAEVPPRVAKPSSVPSNSAVNPSSSAPNDGVTELELVKAMQRSLKTGEAGRALALADEHARRFPNGTLVEEREGVRAVGRCLLVEPVERAKVAEAFSRHFGSSPYAARVKAACR